MAPADPERIDRDLESAGLRAAIETLEAIVRDRALLGTLPVVDRTRLLSAAGKVYNPDLETRRRGTKALRRQEKEDRRARDEQVLAETGLRVLRDKPVFTTPNLEAPNEFVQEEAGGAAPERREVIEPQHCLHLQAPLPRAALLLRPAVHRRAPTSTIESATRSPICAAASRSSPARA